MENRKAELKREELELTTGGTYSPTVPDVDKEEFIDPYPEDPQPRPYD